jgi:SM-20-related protein
LPEYPGGAWSKAMTLTLFELSADLNRRDLANRFATHGRVQVRDFLTPESARNMHDVLANATPWGFSWKAGSEDHRHLRADQLRSMPPAEREAISRAVAGAAHRGEYAVRFASYPILDAYLQRWSPDSPQDILLEHINAAPFLDLAREICGIPELRKADAQATLFAPGDHLGLHTDSHVAEGWRVAYVMNFADADWKPDWGGYLNFYSNEGDIVEGWRPRFNALNLLRVPQLHAVSYVPPFAPVGRFAITGWLRDR